MMSMAKTKTILIGFLVVLIAATYIYVSIPGVKIKVDKSATTFYVYLNDSWVISGKETLAIYNGTKKLSFNTSNVTIENEQYGVNGFKITRTVKYPGGQIIKQYYFFNGSVSDKELFPINSTVEITGADGLIFRYTASSMDYNGPTYGLTTEIKVSFGKSMKIEFEPGYKFGKVYSTGSLRLDYNIDSGDKTFTFKMYDPAAPVNVTLYLNGSSINRTIELGEPLNITATSNVTGLGVCLSVNHSYLGDNFLCNNTSVTYTWNPTSSLRAFNDSSTSKNLNYSSTANQTVYLRFNTYDDINSAKLNLTGVNTTYPENYPANVKVYINNTLSNSIPGTLREGTNNLATFNDSYTAKNVTFTTAGSQASYIAMPKNAIVTGAYLNMSSYYVNTSDPYFAMVTENSISTDVNLNIVNFANVNDSNWNSYGYVHYTTPPGTGGRLRVIENYTYNAGWLTGNNNFSVKLRTNSSLGTTYIWGWNYTSGSWNILLGSYSGSTYDEQNRTIVFNGTDLVSASNPLRIFIDVIVGSIPDPGGSDCRYFESQLIWYNKSYPVNPYMDVEGDGDKEWSYTGIFNQSNNKTANFSDSLNHYLTYCTANSYGNCIIPIVTGTSAAGINQMSALNITYTLYFNPVTLSASMLQNYLDSYTASSYVNVPIRIEANQGNVTVNGLNISYNGTGIFNVTASWAGNATYSASSSQKNVTVYHSNFIRAFPHSFMTEPIFLPMGNSSRNVSMYGQTASKPGYNITGKGYSSNFNLSIRLNQSMDSCMNMTVGNADTTYNFTINTTRRQVLSNITLEQSTGLWLKLNLYNCNTSTIYRNWWIELKSCTVNAMACW